MQDKKSRAADLIEFASRMDKVKGIDNVLERGQRAYDHGKAKHRAEEQYHEFAEDMSKVEGLDKIVQRGEQTRTKRKGH
jgi:hypothetical protein